MVRWGFLGAGAIASHALAPAVHAAKDAELYAVAARDPARAAALRPTGVTYASYEQLLEDPLVDVVYVALANDAHRPWTVAALEAGKHVLCEKPIALNVADLDVMAAAADQAERLLVEALFYRWHPAVRRAEQLIRDGRIGTVRRVDAGFAFSGVAQGNFRLDPARGGGAMYDVGCYPISAALMAFGQQPSEVSATFGLGDTGVDLSADAVLTFADGEATVHAGMSEADRQWLVVSGEDGVLEFDDRPFTAWFGPDSELRIGDEAVRVGATDPYRLMVEQVSATIGGERAYVLPLEESRLCAAVTDAAFESVRRGQPVQLT
ncbi:MAG: Gfo/Idh/MocA family protein [Actinomycetes bacterium]